MIASATVALATSASYVSRLSLLAIRKCLAWDNHWEHILHCQRSSSHAVSEVLYVHVLSYNIKHIVCCIPFFHSSHCRPVSCNCSIHYSSASIHYYMCCSIMTTHSERSTTVFIHTISLVFITASFLDCSHYFTYYIWQQTKRACTLHSSHRGKMIELCTSFRECTISLLVSCECMDTDNAYDDVCIIEYFINRLTRFFGCAASYEMLCSYNENKV